MKYIRLVAQYSVYTGLLFLFLVLLFWSTVIEFAPGINDKDLFALYISIFAAFVLYFDKKITSLKPEKNGFFHCSISESFKMVIALKKGKIKTLRIYAFTSEVILPVLRDIDCNVESCFLMLHEFDENSHIKNSKNLNKSVSDLIEKWNTLHQTGKINKLSFCRYKDVPTGYIVSFDNDCILFGGYIPNDISPHGNDYQEPFLLIAESISNAEVIRKENNWFDNLFDYWSKK